MSLSIQNLPKQARPIFDMYTKFELRGPDELHEKIISSFQSLADTKTALSKAKALLPPAEDVAKTQETWLGRVVHKLNADNCFLKMITCILCAIFPSFKQEVEKQNAIQIPIQQVETLRANKHSQLAELEQLFKEFKKPEVLDNGKFLSEIFQNSKYHVGILTKFDDRNLSIYNIPAPLMVGQESRGKQRDFFTIIAKTPNGMLSGLVCFAEAAPSDQPKNWKFETIDGTTTFELPSLCLVENGFIQDRVYKFVKTLIEEGTATLNDYTQKTFSYTLATSEEIVAFKKQKQQKSIYF